MLSLCLSRDCLGKMIIFSIKRRKKTRFLSPAPYRSTLSEHPAERADKSKVPEIKLNAERKTGTALVSNLLCVFVPSLSWQIVVFRLSCGNGAQTEAVFSVPAGKTRRPGRSDSCADQGWSRATLSGRDSRQSYPARLRPQTQPAEGATSSSN